MAERSPTDQVRSFWGKIPFPTMLTLCLVALGIAAAAFWGWEVVVAQGWEYRGRESLPAPFLLRHRARH